MDHPQTRMNSKYMRTLTCKKHNPAFNPYHPKITEEAQPTNQIRIHQHVISLRVRRREKNGRHFPRIKRESLFSMQNLIQPLAVAADVAAVVVPAAAVVLIPRIISSISPRFSTFTTTVPGPSSQRINVKLPLFPGSKGYVGAPYRPKTPCSSDTDLATAGSSPILSLLHVFGVCVVPSKSPSMPTPRTAPPEHTC